MKNRGARRQINRFVLILLLSLGRSLVTSAQDLPVRRIKPGQAQVPPIVIVRGNDGKTIGSIGFPRLDAASKEATSLTIEDKMNSLRLANITGSPRASFRLSAAKPYQDIFDRDATGKEALQLLAFVRLLRVGSLRRCADVVTMIDA